MHQAAPAPLGGHTTLRALPRGRRALSNLRERWNVPGSGPRAGVLLALLVVFSPLMLVSLDTSAASPGVNWASSAWQPTPTHAPAPLQVAGRVQPILQADRDAGYDTSAQHDQWWDSACSAAAFTEVARAWGKTSVTLGHILDRLLAHDPPYITVSGGLMSQDGWGWMAQADHLQAKVAWYTYTFGSLVQQVVRTGIPIIIGMKGGNPNDPWGHFVVVTGGDSKEAQIVDSSLWRMHTLPRSFFTRPTSGILSDPIWWSGETILLTPLVGKE